MTRVLFVDDEPRLLESLRDALRSKRRDWEMDFAPSGTAALAELERARYDVVVTDMRMPGMDGAALLRHVRALQPAAVRIVLSGYSEIGGAARAVAVAHRLLAKPCLIDDLARAVERSCALTELCEREDRRRAATGAGSLPPVPALYARLGELGERGDATLEEAEAIVEQDAPASARVVQLASLASFGAARSTAPVGDAVMQLGLRALRAFALAAGAIAAFDPAQPVARFSLAALEERGAQVAAVARFMFPEGLVQDHAVTAGLLNDVGMLVTAAEAPEQLAAALEQAAEQDRPLADVEYELRGTSHAEVGAHLLARWGLPHVVVEAVAHHHRAHPTADGGLDAAAAVHIADALVTEAMGEPGSGAAPLDLDFLERLGVLERLPTWRAMAAREAGLAVAR